jgi:hypothetical protein
MSKQFLLIAAAVFSFGTASAFADIEATLGSGDPVKFEDLKRHCALQGKEGKGGPGEQLPLKNPFVSCQDTITTWVATGAGELSLPASRKIVTSLKDKFFYIPQTEGAANFQTKGASCPKLKEVEQTVILEEPITCDQVNNITSLVDFCVQVIDGKKGGGQKLGDQRDTGRYFDTCGNGSIGGKKQ